MLDAFHGAGGEIIFGAAVLGAIGVFTTALWKLAKLLKKLIDKLDLIDEIPAIKQDIEKIRKELTTNGGSSLKDEFVKSVAESEKFRRNLSAKLRLMDNRAKEHDKNA